MCCKWAIQCLHKAYNDIGNDSGILKKKRSRIKHPNPLSLENHTVIATHLLKKKQNKMLGLSVTYA